MNHPFWIILFYELKRRMARRSSALTAAAAFALPLILIVVIAGPFDIDVDQRLRLTGALIITFELVALFAFAGSIFGQLRAGERLYYRLSPLPLWGLFLLQAAVFYCGFILPIALALPLVAFFWALPSGALPVLVVVTLIGGLSLSLIAAMIGALTAQSHTRFGTALLTGLPLSIPVVIFSLAALDHHHSGEPYMSDILFLISLALFEGVVCAFLGQTALKNLTEQNKQ